MYAHFDWFLKILKLTVNHQTSNWQQKPEVSRQASSLKHYLGFLIQQNVPQSPKEFYSQDTL